MRKWLLAILCTLMTVSAADIAQSRTRFSGFLVVETAAGSCPDYNPVGYEVLVRFLPANVGDNGPDSHLALHEDEFAFAFTLAGGSFDQTLRTVTGVTVGESVLPYDGVAIRFKSQIPKVIDTTTNFVNIKGTLNGWDFMPACNVDFRMAAPRREE